MKAIWSLLWLAGMTGNCRAECFPYSHKKPQQERLNKFFQLVMSIASSFTSRRLFLRKKLVYEILSVISSSVGATGHSLWSKLWPSQQENSPISGWVGERGWTWSPHNYIKSPRRQPPTQLHEKFVKWPWRRKRWALCVFSPCLLLFLDSFTSFVTFKLAIGKLLCPHWTFARNYSGSKVLLIQQHRQCGWILADHWQNLGWSLPKFWLNTGLSYF